MRSFKGLLSALTAAAFAVSVSAYNFTLPAEAAKPEENKEFSAVSVSDTAKAVCPDGYVPAAESETMVLYADTTDGAFANYDKTTGVLWRSKPENAESDPKASASEINRMKSMLYIRYFDEANNEYTYNSYEHCVKNELLSCYNAENGIIFEYTMINRVRTIDDIPEFISEERFKKYFLDAADGDEAKILQKRFSKQENGCYKRFNIPQFELKKIFAVMERSGYDSEQLEFDNKENAKLITSGAKKAQPSVQFVIPVRVTLSDASTVSVSVDTDGITGTEGYHLSTIRLNEYYGAPDSAASGYLLVPDGSGAVIRLNNGKSAGDEISVAVYGEDSVSERKSQGTEIQNAHLPVFGIGNGGYGLLAEIKEGQSLAHICALSSGFRSSYNRICAEFTYEQSGTVELDNKTSQQVFEEKPYSGNYTVNYHFTQAGKAKPTDLAEVYRNILFKDRAAAENGDMPFYLQLLGSVDKLKQFLCFRYFGNEVLTSYVQAGDIAGELSDAGVEGLSVQYSGMLKGGLRHYSMLKPSLNKYLGSEKELEDLIKRLESDGTGLYLDASVVTVYQNGGGFRYTRNASKFISQKTAQLFSYSQVTRLAVTENELLKGIPYNLVLSAGYLGTAAERMNAFSDRYGINGLCLQDLGTQIVSDQSTKHHTDRETARNYALDGIKLLSDKKLLSNGGNAEVLPYVSGVLEAPVSDSGYAIEDESIPFYQMVMHGYTDYAAQAVNLSASSETAFLKAFETGSSLKYCVMAADFQSLKNTAYTEYYSVEYSVWKDEMIRNYKELNSVLSPLRSCTITGYDTPMHDVTCTEYSNGTRIYVNYSYNEVRIGSDGELTVPARGYYVSKS